MGEGRLAQDQGYAEIKAAALQLLIQHIPDDQRGKVEKFLEEIEAQTITADDAERVLGQIVAKSQVLAPVARKPLIDVLQSPPFYFFFGFGLLAVAFITSQTGLNTSLTFLVAMLGVAIMLYGTGSQAAGAFGSNPELAAQLLREQRAAEAGQPAPVTTVTTTEVTETADSSTTTMTDAATTGVGGSGEATPAARPSRPISPAAANLVIAGGAAVLTAFFGWGVITYQNEIRQVFRDHDQYTRVRVEFCDIAVTECADPDIHDNVGLDAPGTGRSVLTEATLRQIREKAYLETGLGERAYGKADENGLEFIVFERDLGQSGTIKLLGATAEQGTSLYTTDDVYFTLRPAPGTTEQNDACLVRASENSCLYIATVRDGLDLNRVPRVVIRAVLTPQSVITDSDDPVVPQ